MSTNLRETLNAISDILMEPPSDQTSAPVLPALSLGLWDQGQFLDAFVNVATEFLRETGIFKVFLTGDSVNNQWLIPLFGVPQYTLPDYVTRLYALFYNKIVVWGSDSTDMDETLSGAWGLQVGTPMEWRSDLMQMKLFSLFPAPASPPAQPDSMSVIVEAGLQTVPPVLDAPVEKIMDSFLPFITQGILAIAFSTDSEVKDLARAQYCRDMFDQGISVVKGMMGSMEDVQ